MQSGRESDHSASPLNGGFYTPGSMSTLQPLEYERPAPSGVPNPRAAMAVLWLVMFADMMGFGLIVPQMAYYAARFEASPIQIGLLFSLYSACQFVAAPFLGLLSDRFGRRPVLAISQVGTVAGYVLLGWTLSVHWTSAALGLWMINLSRIIDGISGGNISTAQAYIGDISDRSNRAARMGLMGAAFGIGFSAGPMLGGALSLVHPAAPAFGAAGFCTIALVLTIILLPESHRPGSRDQDSESWLHPSRFVPVLRHPVVGQLILIGTLSMLGYVMLEVVFALFLKDVFGYSQTTANWFFAYIGATIVIVQAGLTGVLTRKFGEWSLAITGAVAGTISQVVYAWATFQPIVVLLLAAAMLNAVGRSLQFPTINSLVSHAAGGRQGTTFGAYHGLVSLARVVGPLVAGALFGVHPALPFAAAGLILVIVTIWTMSVRAKAGADGLAAASPRPAEAS
jgi:MFS transporter, DHA1 family, tetracycline resistance protein